MWDYLLIIRFFYPSFYLNILYTLRMSNSHRKTIDEDFHSYSFTEEFRMPKKKEEANRTHNKVEPAQSSKQNQNLPKAILKKFLNEQAAKICKRREKSSSCKKKKREEADENMTALQGQLSEIKKAIQKMVLTEVSPNPISVVAAKRKHSMEEMKRDYQRIIQEKELELQIQLESKARLEEAHIQSQFFAQQTKEFSESIKKELSEVAIKHVDCERRFKQIQLLNRDLEKLRTREEQLILRLRGHEEKEIELENRLQKQSRLFQEQIYQLNQFLLMRDGKLEELMENNHSLQKSLTERKEHFLTLEVQYRRQIQAAHTRHILLQEEKAKVQKQKETQIFILQEKIAFLQAAENQNSKTNLQEHSISERKMSDFWSTSRVESSSSVQSMLSLPESKVAIEGLSNMERKCQELYRQIRQERQKLNGFQEQEKNGSRQVKLLEKESLPLMENNEYLQQVLMAKENTIKDLQQKCRKFQIKVDEMGELQRFWEVQKNALGEALRESRNSKELSQKILSSKLQQLENQLHQQKERSRQIINKKAVYEAEIREMKEEYKKIRWLEREICDFRERESKSSAQQAKLICENEVSLREITFWKEQYFGLELEIQSLKKQNEELEISIEKNKIELLEHNLIAEEHKKQNQSSLKRCKSQLSTISQQIDILNGRLLMAQQIIQHLKRQVEGYQQKIVHLQQTNREQAQRMSEKMQEFSLLSDNQVKHLRERLEDICIDKRDLQVQLNRLKEENEVFTLRLKTLIIELDQLVPKHSLGQLTNEINNKHHLQISQYECKIQQLNAHHSQQLQQRQIEYTSLVTRSLEQKAKLDIQIQDLSAKLKASVEQYNKKSIELEIKQTILSRIQAQAKALKQQHAINEEKILTAIDQKDVFQQDLQTLSKRNSKLQQQNTSLKNTVNIQQQKISLMVSTIDAFVEKEKACQEHIAQLQSDVDKLQEKEKALILHAKQLAKQAETTYSQYNAQLQQKIHELGVELDQYQRKCFDLGEELTFLQARATELESILKESHSLLTQQRAQREDLALNNKKLLLSMQKYQLQLATRQKQLDTSKKQQQLLASKLSQAQQKHRQLRKRWQGTQQLRHTAAKELQSQAISLLVLREQNRNIEKVMSEQLNQRKAIIEQLVSQKKTLYSHLNH